jgi:hypothetical protein
MNVCGSTIEVALSKVCNFDVEVMRLCLLELLARPEMDFHQSFTVRSDESKCNCF